MIRIDNRIEIVRLGWTIPRLFTGRYAIQVGKTVRPERWKTAVIKSRLDAQQADPVLFLRDGRRVLWMFHDHFYWESEDLNSEDVKALALRRERNKNQTLQTARSLMRAEAAGKLSRSPISTDLRRAVFERDGGACGECGATFDIQYDHILPVSLGGATTIENLQLLCGDCNRAKSDSL